MIPSVTAHWTTNKWGSGKATQYTRTDIHNAVVVERDRLREALRAMIAAYDTVDLVTDEPEELTNAYLEASAALKESE